MVRQEPLLSVVQPLGYGTKLGIHLGLLRGLLEPTLDHGCKVSHGDAFCRVHL
jgi:hypothetical protein